MNILLLKSDKPNSSPLKIDEGGGWGQKTGIRLCIYHPINLHGLNFRLLVFGIDFMLYLRKLHSCVA